MLEAQESTSEELLAHIVLPEGLPEPPGEAALPGHRQSVWLTHEQPSLGTPDEGVPEDVVELEQRDVLLADTDESFGLPFRLRQLN